MLLLRKFVALIFIISVCTMFCGCWVNDYSDDNDSVAVSLGALSGSVTASGSISAGANMRANQEFYIGSASVWLQEHPQIRATTNSDGSFVLRNIPFGSWRVVADLKARDNKIYKARSSPIDLSLKNPYQDIGSISIELASNRTRVVLQNEDGESISTAILTLWGEPCEIGIDGIYLTPPLPPNVPIAEILVALAGGFTTGPIIAPFTENGDSLVISTLTATGSENKAPSAWLFSNKLPGDKINPGEVVKLWGVFLDENSEDMSKLTQSWKMTGGSLASGTTTFPDELKQILTGIDLTRAQIVPVEWTAPATVGYSILEFTVIDPAGLKGIAQHPLSVVAFDTDPNPVPSNNHAPVASVEAVSTIIAGKPLVLKVIASDSDLDLLKFNWSVSPSGGSFNAANAMTTTWTSPSATGTYQISCQVTEIRESPLSVTATVSVVVTEEPIIVTPGKIAGHVLDESGRAPIAKAVVAISGTNIYAITDGTGYFEFINVEPGSYDLIATKNGYVARTYPGIIVPSL